MKTYIFNTIKRYKRFSETLEVKEAICNKAWWVFNDSGEKELYIFQEDGTLYITYGGKVSHGTWKYIPANKSIIISASEQSYMVHATFMDSTIFALQVDGTEQHAFLIDEQNKQNFLPKSYSDVMNYFIAKEQKYLEQERRKKQLLIEEEKERRERELEEERIRELKNRASEIRCKISWDNDYWSYYKWIGLYIFLPSIILILAAAKLFPEEVSQMGNTFDFLFIWAILLSIPSLFLVSYICFQIGEEIQNWIIAKWKKEHPNEPANIYL